MISSTSSFLRGIDQVYFGNNGTLGACWLFTRDFPFICLCRETFIGIYYMHAERWEINSICSSSQLDINCNRTNHVLHLRDLPNRGGGEHPRSITAIYVQYQIYILHPCQGVQSKEAKIPGLISECNCIYIYHIYIWILSSLKINFLICRTQCLYKWSWKRGWINHSYILRISAWGEFKLNHV